MVLEGLVGYDDPVARHLPESPPVRTDRSRSRISRPIIRCCRGCRPGCCSTA
ncbi:MAG: beta-lactamase family protein [Actinomycetota bacterium]|nr:beta-lactamase family protein [Actinomycetota bacterium]